MHAANQPTLVMLAGLPGTGKSTLAHALSHQLGWPVVDKDTLNTVLLNTGLAQAEAGDLAYALVFAVAHDLLVEQGLSVILDTAGRQPFIVERAKALAEAGHARLKIIRCVAPQATRAERLASRIARPSQWMTNHATDDEQAAWYRHLPPTRLVLATDQPLEALVAQVRGFLQGA